MKRLALASGAFAGAMLLLPAAGLAQAEPTCGDRSEIVAKLAQDFKERQQAVGIVNEQAVLEVYISDTGTWTILATGTDGNSCVISAGENWQGNGFIEGFDASF